MALPVMRDDPNASELAALARSAGDVGTATHRLVGLAALLSPQPSWALIVWLARAAVRAAELDRVSESTARGGWFPSVHLPRDAEPVGTDLSLWGSGGGGQFDRAALRPIVDLIGPHLRVERLDEVLRPPEAKRPATAGMKCLDHDTGCALLTLFQSDSRLRAPSIRGDRDQSAVAWLVEHGLAVESPGTGPRLADWLFHVMSRDTDGRLTPVLSLPRQRWGPAARG